MLEGESLTLREPASSAVDDYKAHPFLKSLAPSSAMPYNVNGANRLERSEKAHWSTRFPNPPGW